jgi:hypothetical protein
MDNDPALNSASLASVVADLESNMRPFDVIWQFVSKCSDSTQYGSFRVASTGYFSNFALFDVLMAILSILDVEQQDSFTPFFLRKLDQTGVLGRIGMYISLLSSSACLPA